MPHHMHAHLHARANGWDEIGDGWNSFVDQLLPGKKTTTSAAKQSPTPTPPSKSVVSSIQNKGAPISQDSPSPTTADSPIQTDDSNNGDSDRTTKAAASSFWNVGQPVQQTSRPSQVIPTTVASVDSTIAIAQDTAAPTDSPAPMTTTQLPLATSADAALSGTDAFATASATPTPSTSTNSGDSNVAAKAGIAIGVLAGFLVMGLLVFFIYNRRKKMAAKAEEDDEKLHGTISSEAPPPPPAAEKIAPTQTSLNAPRLSLRPGSEFLPGFGDRQPAQANAQGMRAIGESPWERPMTSDSNHHENPFGNHAERLDNNAQKNLPETPIDPFNAPENVVGVSNVGPGGAPAGHAAVAGAAVAGAAAGAALVAGAPLARKQSLRKDNSHQQQNLTRGNLDTIPAGPASPNGTEFSFSSVNAGQAPGPSNSANAIAAAGGPPATTVHRVQLDFKPTMEDEMGLTAGQLVRLLHEYDDGWALCIRLDRSEQGVVPRTCLSTRPVKPRPNGPPGGRPGPPVNPQNGPGPRGPPRGPPQGRPRGPGPNYPPGQRPMTPQGGPRYDRPESPMRPSTSGGRPQSPGFGRPQSPAMRPHSPAGMQRSQSPGPMGPPRGGRPQSPGPRSQSPGPNGPQRSPTGHGPSPMNPAGPARPASPAGPAPGKPIGRKPVPGQAL